MGLITRSQLKGGMWQRLFKDVYVHQAVALTHRVQCQATALVLPPGAAVSGASAAHLLGADVLKPGARVEVTVPREMRMPDWPDVATRYSELQPTDLVEVGGIPATTPVRTAFDLARRIPLDEAVVGVDALLHVCGLQLSAISAYANDGRASWHGVRRIPAVLALAAPGAESPMETRLRLVLVRAGLPEPVLQHRVLDHRGKVVARLDLAYPDSRLGVEYDGEHHLEPTTVRRDLLRQNALRALGWTVLRFTSDDVLRAPGRLAAQVAAALRPYGKAA